MSKGVYGSMKKRLVMAVLALCLATSLLACGKKTDDESEALQTQAQMTWQDHYDLGVRLLNEGNYADAILAFQAAIQIDPKNVEAYVLLANVYNIAGDTERAVATLQNGLDQTGNAERIQQYVDKFDFRIDEQGKIYQLTEKESIAESLAELPVEEQINYYCSKNDQDWQGCFEDNILVFGQDAKTITLEQLRTEALQRGWESEDDLEINYLPAISYTRLSSWRSFLIDAVQTPDDVEDGVGVGTICIGYDSHNYMRRSELSRQMAPGTENGILNLQMGDSLEAVLSKFGVAYAKEVADAALLWPNDEESKGTYPSATVVDKYIKNEKELPDGAKTGERLRIAYTESADYTSSGQEAIRLEYRVNYKNDVCTELELFFYGPEYELWYYKIHNY